MFRNIALSLLLLALLATPVQAQDRPAPCTGDAFREFDFWIGDWEVHDKDGKLLGHNRITSILGGCALEENWASANGNYVGTSYNMYERARQVWHQTWADNSGLLLLLEGALTDGSMVLEGSTGSGKKMVRQRITWTPLTDGRVRQIWEQEKDGKYRIVFEGYYGKVAKED